MRVWGNWQTQMTQNHPPQGIRVQISGRALEIEVKVEYTAR